MKNRRACAGETLGETLCAMLVMALGMLMLSGAVLVSARLNYRAERLLNPSVTPDEEPNSSFAFVRLRDADNRELAKIPVRMTEYNGDFYYEPQN
ncbi:MAG: hypothetical protein IKN96_06765 [Oscillibacter sp.]|nr:hypothetical protein [Oscillibacter sp.]